MAQGPLSIHSATFSASTTSSGSLLQLRLEGSADAEVAPELGAYLGGVHAAAQATGVEEVVVDLRALHFMSSSCFKCFVTWISSIAQLEDTKRYVVHLVANPDLHWQRRSLDALRNFALDVVTLSV